MSSFIYKAAKQRLTIEIKPAESNSDKFGSYVKLNGVTDKIALNKAVKDSLKLYHQIYHQTSVFLDDTVNKITQSASPGIRIYKKNFTSYDCPELEAWLWLRNEILQPFVTPNYSLYQTYLLTISNKECWFFLGHLPVHGIDHLQEYRFYHLLTQKLNRSRLALNDFDVMSPQEKKLLNEYGKSNVDYPRQRTITDLFEEKAFLQPTATAVFANDCTLSYGELNAQANQLASYLINNGVKVESLVPVCMTRSSKMIVAILGIMKAGGAYVPVDPGYPKERIAYLLQDTAASVIITDEPSFLTAHSNTDVLVIDLNKDWLNISKEPVDNQVALARPDHLAYIIYTSGTTGRPKGVMIAHKALLDHSYGVIKSAGLNKCKSFALFSPLVFDAGHSIIHSAFILGASLHVLSSKLIADSNQLSKYFNNNPIDCLKIVPSLWLSYALDDFVINADKVMIFGGEPFSTIILDKLKAGQYEGEIYNHYGPTETTIGKSIYKVSADKQYQAVPIGKPFSNTRFYVVDAAFKQVPIGIAGQLCIAGDGLARGYLNQPETTDKFFIANPFSQIEGSKMYQTGDMVKWRADGNLEYLGRKDEQVKIRGHRIELSEIETALNECSFVKQAVVICRKNDAIGNSLEAFIITANDAELKSIKDAMQSRLPEYMVPATWHRIENFPLTINGKIDKKALEHHFREAHSEGEYSAPTNALQIQIMEIWKTLFKKECVCIHANFIAFGGHSLLAMRMVAAIRKDLQTDLTIAVVFKFPTIALLSAHIQSTTQNLALPALVKFTTTKPVPLSFSQSSLWFTHQAAGSFQYHLPFSFTVSGAIEINFLQDAFTAIIQRHKILRTVVKDVDGVGYQFVLPAPNWQLQIVDGMLFDSTNNTREKFAKQFIAQPFNLANEPTIRAALITYNNQQHELLYVLHHIASDGWSSSIFINELLENYNAITNGRASVLTDLPIQFSDYAIWQQNMAKAGLWTDQLAYWKTKLVDSSPLLLPTDYNRPAVQNITGASVDLVIPLELYSSLQTLSKQHGATLFVTLTSALNILLHRYTNQNDISIGTPTAGRNQQATEQLIGYFINTVVLRNEFANDLTFLDLLALVNKTTIEAFEHQDIPFEKVVEATTNERDVSRNSLFQVMLVLQNADAATNHRLGEATMKRSNLAATLQATSMFDATFIFSESEQGLQITLAYATALFKHSTAERMLSHLGNLFQSIVLNPKCSISKLDILSKEEKHRLVVGFNPATPYASEKVTILDLIQQQVLLQPFSIAVSFEGELITYKQLDERSDKLAAYLTCLNVYQKLVPIIIGHSIDMLVSILAIIKAGAAYVPIDPEYPLERIDFIISDTAATVVLCNKAYTPKATGIKQTTILEVDGDWEHQPQIITSAKIRKSVPDDMAYVIYTSGSTGKPKGTLITHRGLAASSTSRLQFYGNTGKMLLIPSIAFDSSVAVIFGSLVSGGTLILCRHQQIKEPSIVQGLLQNTDTLLCVPSYYRFLLEEGIVQSGNMSRVIVAGENLDNSLVNKHFLETNNCKLYNEYGPTEATVWSSVMEVKPGLPVTIGKPINTTLLYIVNNSLQLVPEGVAGELCIGGPQVATGYLNLTEKTNEKFISDPFCACSNNKMYRTGDLARWLPNGEVEYLGRIDDQLKIRGNRVEPAAIEHLLNECAGVVQTIVIAKAQIDGTNRLVAYVNADGSFNPGAYTQYLKERLPLFMVPEQWVQVQHFALTRNGKIDKQALQKIDIAPSKTNSFTAPKPGLQYDLAVIWQQMLLVDRIGIYDNFFAIGGHSLLAMKLVSAIKRQLLFDVSINNLFRHPTIAELSDFIEKRIDNPNLSPSDFKHLIGVKSGSNKMPLYIVAGGGSTALRFKTFSEMLDADQPVYVFQAPVDEEHLTNFPMDIEGIATTFLKELLEHNPQGPYSISGHCIGGLIAFEMARQLQANGKAVKSLILFDTILKEEQKLPDGVLSGDKRKPVLVKLMNSISIKLAFQFFLLSRHPHSFFHYRLIAFRKQFFGRNLDRAVDLTTQEADVQTIRKSEAIYSRARSKYSLSQYNGAISLFIAKERYYFIDEEQKVKFKRLSWPAGISQKWSQLCTALTISEAEGNHSDMFSKSHGTALANRLQTILNTSQKP